MPRIIGEKELIFTKTVNCHSCNRQNTYFITVKLYGHNWYGRTILEGVGLCPHSEKAGKEIGRKEVESFLKAEKQEAEKFATQASDEKRKDIQHFISDVNTVLSSLHRL